MRTVRDCTGPFHGNSPLGPALASGRGYIIDLLSSLLLLLLFSCYCKYDKAIASLLEI